MTSLSIGLIKQYSEVQIRLLAEQTNLENVLMNLWSLNSKDEIMHLWLSFFCSYCNNWVAMTAHLIILLGLQWGCNYASGIFPTRIRYSVFQIIKVRTYSEYFNCITELCIYNRHTISFVKFFNQPALTVHSVDLSHIYPTCSICEPHRTSLYRPEPPYVLYICAQYSLSLLLGWFRAQGHAPLLDAFTVLLLLIHLHFPDDISFFSPMKYSPVSYVWIVWFK